MVLCFLPPPQGTGACLPRPGLGWTEVRCVQEGHGRQAGPGLCLDPQILRTILVFSVHSEQWGQREDKGAGGLYENLFNTGGFPVQEGLKVWPQKKVFQGWLLSLFMVRKDPQFWGVSLSKDRSQDS